MRLSRHFECCGLTSASLLPSLLTPCSPPVSPPAPWRRIWSLFGRFSASRLALLPFRQRNLCSETQNTLQISLFQGISSPRRVLGRLRPPPYNKRETLQKCRVFCCPPIGCSGVRRLRAPLTKSECACRHAQPPVAAARGPAVKRAGDAAPLRTIFPISFSRYRR